MFVILTEHQKEILLKVERTSIQSLDAKSILGQDFCNDVRILRSIMREGITTNDPKAISVAMELYWLNDNNAELEKEFNEVLMIPNHNRHQRMLKYLQDVLKYPSSVDAIKFLLNCNFEKYFIDTGSEDSVIVQWLSHALVGIGTEDALNVIEEYSESSHLAIAEGMKYRLKRIEEGRVNAEKKLKSKNLKKQSWLHRLFKN